jgi:hypothetical protein
MTAFSKSAWRRHPASVSRAFATAFLYQVNPTDPKLFGISALVLIIAPVVANLVPLQKMVKLDPLESLRME